VDVCSAGCAMTDKGDKSPSGDAVELNSFNRTLQVAPAESSSGDVVELNVGGALYTTSRLTLSQDQDSLLAKWFGCHVCENVTPPTKPEVHNIPQRRTEPRPEEETCARNSVKFGLWFLRYASERTNRQTDRQTDRHTGTFIVRTARQVVRHPQNRK